MGSWFLFLWWGKEKARAELIGAAVGDLGREGVRMNGYQCKAMLTTDHAASRYGQPVLVLDNGEPPGHGDVALADYRIVTTVKERQALVAAGFALPDANGKES